MMTKMIHWLTSIHKLTRLPYASCLSVCLCLCVCLFSACCVFMHGCQAWANELSPPVFSPPPNAEHLYFLYQAAQVHLCTCVLCVLHLECPSAVACCGVGCASCVFFSVLLQTSGGVLQSLTVEQTAGQPAVMPPATER